MKMPERKQLILGAVLVAVIGVFAFGMYKPLHAKINTIRQAQDKKSFEKLRADTEMQQLPVLKQQLEALKIKVGDFSQKIPDQRDLGGFLQDIAAAMNKHNLKDQLVEPREEFKVDNCTCIPIKMQASGRLADIFGLFKSLEKFSRLIRIEKVELKTNQDLGPVVTMVAQADIYYQQ